MEKSLKSANKKHITVGKFGKPHGLKGYLRLYPLTDFPGHLLELKAAYIGENRVEIESCQESSKFFIIKLKGISNRDTAAPFTDKLLTIDREDAAPLNEGEFYCFDLIGLDVYDKEVHIGKLREILKTGSNDVYAVRDETSHREYLVPALKKIVKRISIENGRIDVDLPEELR